jgi:hypothetical protein
MKPCFLSLILFSLTTCLLAGCGSTKQVAVEQAPPTYQATPVSTPATTALAAAPKLPEVEEAVKRVFKDAAVVHPDYKNSFLTGDFNGDHSQDLAVVVKPAKLEEMNEQYPSWILRDPRVPYDPQKPLHVEKDEALLAVIHGYGANDWRDAQATQTFLLKNVVGSGLRVQDGKEFVKDNTGRKLPRPQGDLIGETLKGADGYLYYSTASYAWYDPKTFTGEPQTAGVFHQGRMRRPQQ